MFNWFKKKPILKAIVAIDNHNGIGYKGDLLYKISADMKYFVEQTGTDTVIMRSGTFESFGAKPLPNRTNIVISRRDNYKGNGAIVAKTLKKALKKIPKNKKVAWIIGGAGLYQEALLITSELYITQIYGTKEADTFFPIFKDSFTLKSASEKHFDEKNNVHFQFQIWEQKL